MNKLKEKHFYKVISLFIKAMLLTASFYYIIQKIINSSALESFHQLKLSPLTISYILLVIALMFCNWLLEAKKWQLLIAPLENISLATSIQSIFAGISIGIFTPNRIGEFAGRVFFLKSADKLTASIKSLVGSILQLFITIVVGLLAIGLYYRNYASLLVGEIIDAQKKVLFISVIVLILILAVILMKVPYFTFLRKYLKELFSVKKKILVSVLFLSLFRYVVFTIQYFLILLVVGIDINFSIAWILIAITFFISTAIPTFVITEIIVRSAIAVYVFSILSPGQSALIASASILLWFINIALPAFIGSLLLGNFHFFKKVA